MSILDGHKPFNLYPDAFDMVAVDSKPNVLKNLSEYPEVRRCLAGKSLKTKTVYLSALRKYVEFRGLTPTELIDEIDADRQLPVRDRGRVEHHVRRFIEYLQRDYELKGKDGLPSGMRGMAPKSVSAYTGAILSFYGANNFQLKIKTPRGAPKKENARKPLRADSVKRLVDHAGSLRDRAIILMMFQSGMDISTVCRLDYGDVADGLRRDECPLAINTVRGKEQVAYVTFIGRDAVEALQAYLEQREARLGPIALREPLFIKEQNKIALRERISPKNIQDMMRQLAVTAGVVSDAELDRADINPCSPHALRAAFSTIMKLEGVNSEVVDYWMGHCVPYDAAYFVSIVDEMREIYREHEAALSINRAVEQVQQLERKYNGKMETYDEIIERQASKIQRLETELDQVKQSQEQLIGNEIIRALDNPEIGERVVGALEKLQKEKENRRV